MSDAWTAAVWDHFTAGNLTPLFRDVLLRLQKFVGVGGCYPSHDTLASSARCGRTTVKEALGQGRALGLLAWVSGASRRTSNRYTLVLPKVRVEAGKRAHRAARRVAAVARALVAGLRPASQQKQTSQMPTRGSGWRDWPQPQAPIRTVAEQLAELGFNPSQAQSALNRSFRAARPIYRP